MNKLLLSISFILIFSIYQLKASHSMGGELTYECLGNNQYLFTYTLYRDCFGIVPLNTLDIVYYSSCYPNGYTIDLNQVGAPVQIGTVCPGGVTTCNGGNLTGIEAYTYTGIITLPGACNDWTFYHSECCRNAAITTIFDPANQTQVVYSQLNNTNGICNDSPVFTNAPVPFACSGQPFCFNQGGYDAQGDSLVYSLADPLTFDDPLFPTAIIPVTYLNGLTFDNPVQSSLPVVFDPATGDFCVTPSATGVTVFAVLVDEYRNGVYIGTVERDIQLTIQNCSNLLPSLSGINGTSNFDATVCANHQICFTIRSTDNNSGDSTFLSWDNTIPGATFTTFGTKRDSARFCWTPTTADIDPNPHCFTVTVQDNACPYRGTQILSYCITVNGVAATSTSTNVSCFGQNNGTLSVATTLGTPNYSYQWSSSGGPGASSNNLGPGTYSVTVTDANGCTAVTSSTVTQPTQVVGAITPTQPTCGSNNGAASVAASGGTGPYTYLWSPAGGTSATATNLGSGNFSVVITDSHGCTGASNVTLAAPSSPVSYVSGITNSSCSSPTGNITVSVVGGTGPYTYLWSPSGGNAATANNLQPGNYMCTVTDAAGCSSSVTSTIGAPAVVIAAINTSTPESCPGSLDGTANASVSGGSPTYTYAWSPTGGNSSIGTGLSAGQYTVTITDLNGCTGSASVTITSPPIINAIISPTPILCNGAATGSLSVVATGGNGGFSYSWSPSGGSSSTASNLTFGTYTVTVTDVNGCTTTSSSILANPALLTNSISSTGSICGQSSGSASVIASGGTGAYTYVWTPTATNSATINNLSAGQYSVVITDANNCTTTATVSVADLPGPVASLSTVSNVSCANGANGTATIQVAGGSAPLTYSWSPTGGTGASASGLTAGSYTVIVTDINGCTSTVAATITQPAILAASTTTTPVLCNGGTTGSASTIASGGTATYSYLWSPSGGTAATASNLAAGNYSVVVTDLNGCTTTTAATISQPTILTASATATPVLCNGGTTGSASTIASGGTVTYSYLWSPSGGTAATATNLAAGNYSVVVTDLNGCSTTVAATITQPTILAASTTTTPVLCNGGTSGSASALATGGTVTYSYLWSPSGGTAATATNLAAGNYSVVVTDINGCSISTTAAVTQPTLLTSIIPTSTDVSCFGGNNGQATVNASGGTISYTYQWSPSGGTGTVAQNLTAGNYSVTVTDLNGCTSGSLITILQPTLLSASSTSTPVNCFGGNTGTVNAIVNGGTTNYSYIWQPGSILNSNGTGLTAGNYTVTVTDANGCTTSSTVSITQPTLLSTTTTSSPTLCYGGSNGSAQANVVGGTTTYSYNWFPSGGNASTASGLTAGNYSVTVTDANGCTTASAIVVSEPAALSLSTLSTPATCGSSNGSASANVSGGAGTYTYSWSPSGGNSSVANNLSAGAYTVTTTDANGCTASSTSNVSNIGGPTINAFATANVSCFNGNDGTAGSTIANGTGPFTYQWLPSGGTNSTASNLVAGNYSVSVTDANGCTSVANFSISEPTLLIAQAVSNPTSCFGGSNGSASVNVGGGTSAYSYLWSPGAAVTSNPTGLTAGNYLVTVTDANGCTVNATTSVTSPNALIVTASSLPTLCYNGNNGSAQANASGGTAGYTYSWFPNGGNGASAANLSAGNYSVTVTDANGCTLSTSTLVAQPAAIILSTSSTPSTCGSSNGSASVIATGGALPFGYSWSPTGGTTANATNIPSNSYTVIVTDANGCTMSASTSVSSLGGPTITATLVNDVSCFGGNNGSAMSNVSSGSGPYTFSWTPNGGSSATATNLTSGVYSVSVTDINGCTSVANININEPTALVAQASSQASLCFGSSSGSANVVIAGGTVGYQYLWTPGGSQSANATGLTAGNYSVLITDANGCTTSAATTVNQPSQINIIIAPNAALCNGASNGSAQANVNGGTPGYSYSWFPSGGGAASALNLAAGNYSVEVTDANGCTLTSSTTISQPAAMNLATSSLPATCGAANGSVTVNASGGATPYSYSWSPTGGNASTASNLSANTYTVLVTDANGCTLSTSESVSNTGGPTITTSVLANVSCHGLNDGTATVSVSAGTSPFSYQWSPSGGNGQNATNLPAGNYSITVTDANGCISNDNLTITEPTTLAVQISSTDANCAGIGGSATVIVAGGSTPYSYIWSGNSSTTASATGLTGGNYTATITDANGCASSISTTVNQPGGIATVINSTPVSCNGGNNGSATVIANGGSGTITYSWSPIGGSNSSANNLAAGNYSVTVTDVNGCVSTAATVVTEPAAMNLIIIPSPSACGAANGSVQVAASGGSNPYQYSWSPTGGNSSTANNLIAGNYIVTVTDAAGCSSTASALVSNTGGPTVTLNATTDVSCFGGSTGSASVTAVGGNGPFTYSWSPYGGTSASASNLSAGNFTVNTVDVNGCQTALNVTINEPVVLSAQTSSTPAVCGNSNGTATIHSHGGVGNYTYSWTSSATTDSTLSNVASGNYTVTVTDGNGCTSSATINVGSSGGANAILQSSTDVSCDGGSNGSASVSVSGGSAPYTYSWLPYGGTNASATGLSAGNYSVLVSDANNCTSTVLVVINDGAILLLQTATTPASCNGGLDGSASVVVNGGSSPYSFQWTGSSSINATANNLGIGNYTVTVTDANGCVEADVATVNSATAIALSPISTNLNCNGTQNGSASVSPVGGTPPYTYLWTGSTSTTNSATNLNGGYYSLVVTDANGCASIANFTIIEPAPISMSVSPAMTLCIGQDANLSATISGGTAPYNYSWSNGMNTDSILVNPITTATYTVSVTDANNCAAGTQSINITVNPPLTISASAPAFICSGDLVNLSSLASGGNGNYSYSWNNGAITAQNGISYPTGDSTFTVIVTDDCGTPSATAQVNIIVSPAPQVNFGPGSLSGCSPLTVNFVDLSTTLPGSSYTWNFGDNTNSSIQNPIHTYTAEGMYDVSLMVVNNYGCTSSLVITNMINVHGSPNASFVSQPNEATTMEPNITFTNTSIGGSTYIWNFGDSSLLNYELNPQHEYTAAGTYLITLITTNEFGCIDTVRGYVEIGDPFTIYIPNAFTPNLDAINDQFNAYGIGWKDYNLYILDRWGLNIYHSTDHEKPWDGTYESNGKECQSDVYVYKIQVHDTKGELHSFIGHVSLVR